ncbi:TIGR03936 family radical SAM-associated protein [Lapillicoccus jejuensis]|uniref:Radical SAM-linked protein n=2 Tax=Lapillicoccus jejuensis TaxID=402171 RepID=A0A542DVL1_9MICO|nr:radical SAM-linked protein [Lapillicoccus jejuensis]
MRHRGAPYAAAMARQRVPEGPAPEPAVQKLRIRYAKRGRLRFSSTRDFQRALERALRRAGVPMAFSAGFHPHPRISYANAAPTGTASEAEYVEIAVTARVDPEALRAALDEALPPGLDVVRVVEAAPGALADRLQASHWVVAFPGLDAADLESAVAGLLERDEVLVTRRVKTGDRTFDVRSAVVRLEVTTREAVTAGGDTVVGLPVGEGPCAILTAVVRHTTPVVRPDDLLTALRTVAALQPPVSPLVTRLAQGPLDAHHEVTDPLATTQEAVGG